VLPSLGGRHGAAALESVDAMTDMVDRSRARTEPDRGPEQSLPGVAELSDSDLVEAIARRDRSALVGAYARHASRVHALGLRLCGQRGADDLTREIFVLLWSEPERYRAEGGSLRSFLLVQAHRRAVEMLRSDYPPEALEPADTHGAPVPALGAKAVPLALLVGDDMEAVVSSLPDGERHAIVLAYFGGHTYREVASLLGETEAVVKGRIRSGLSSMRALLADT
jgi:RNA polymerase sigma-70 factor (ECF subfamily)